MKTPLIEKYLTNEFITIRNDAHLSLTLCTWGASVYSLYYDEQPMILTLKDKDLFLHSDQFFGKTIGQVAGRIPTHQVINGKDVLLESDEDITLHGGIHNLSEVNFAYTIKESKTSIKIIFSYISKKNQSGFPGKTRFKVTYELLKNKDALSISYLGIPSEDTLINLSNHMYFNFGDTSLDEHHLKINASSYLRCDESLLPIKEEAVIPLVDFNRSTLLSSRMNKIEKKLVNQTLDHTFLFDDVNKNKTQIVLKNKEFKLSLKTTYEACNLYIDSTQSDVDFTNFEGNFKRRGIAIEPQHNLLNRESIITNGHQRYRAKINYKFEKVGFRNE